MEHYPRKTHGTLTGLPVTICRKLGEGASKAVYAVDVHFADDKKASHALAISKYQDPNFCREAGLLANARLKGAEVMTGPFPFTDNKGIQHNVALGGRLEGQSLDHYIDYSGRTPEQTADVMSQVARTLHSAHRDGWVHLDVKPSNIIRNNSDGSCTMIDWEMVDREGTKVDDTYGTLAFMAPEMARSQEKALTSKMDVYSAGITMEEVATGRIHPRWDQNLYRKDPQQEKEILRQIAENKSQPKSNDPIIDLTMKRATHHDPNQRGTALDMMTDLAAFPQARARYDAEDRADILANLIKRSSDPARREPLLDAAAARGLLEDLPMDHPKRVNLVAIEKLAPPPTRTEASSQRPREQLAAHQGTTVVLESPSRRLTR